ncbi:MAG: N-acetylmuramoyl-L-alanine amidase [Actinomycetota bacterium]|nr:N-acetylmuramoyl-L-alanine amidase [Actinomycetota bacterium]
MKFEQLTRGARATILSILVLVLSAQSALAAPLVCIDAGHGGKDTGARSPAFFMDISSGETIFITDGSLNTALSSGFIDGQINQFTALPNRVDVTTGNLRLNEADANLDIALRLKNLLDNAGFSSVMTRSLDDYLTLNQRCALANSANASVFISIHNNSSAYNPLANGVETYYYPASPLGGLLAINLQQGLIKELGSSDRGTKKATFVVLSGTNMPSALIEGAFVSNQDEARLLLTPDYRQKIAQGIASGLNSYLSLRHYSDVPPEHWAYPYIERLTIENVVSGRPDGSFVPEFKIDRAEFARMICKAKKWPLINPSSQSFPDVSPSHQDYLYIESAKANGVINGYEDGTFRPANKITRAEIAAMVSATAGLKTDLVQTTFSDVADTHWALKSILSCRGNGIVSGYPDGTFRPQNDITRAEISKIIFKLFTY